MSQLAQAHDAFDEETRSFGMWLVLLAMTTALVALSAIPAVERALRVGWRDTSVALAAFVLANFAATVAYRVSGPGRRYQVFNALETCTGAAGLWYLLVRSGSAHSFFWLALLWQATTVALRPEPAGRLALYVGPLVIAGAFLLQGSVGDAVLSLFAGVVVGALYRLIARARAQLDASLRVREELQAALGATELRLERERIARDLHDGLGSELAALVWRGRALRQRCAAELGGDVDMIVDSLRSTIAQLSGVVWSMEGERRTFDELVAKIESRARELCPGLRVVVESEDHDSDRLLDSGVQAATLMAAFELLRNVSRHAEARSVTVRVSKDDSLELSVSDDGKGIVSHGRRAPGGLRGLDRRASELGGTFDIEATGEGCVARLVIPLSDALTAESGTSP